MQQVPLKNKLSYIWARVTGKDAIYSRVLTKSAKIEVYNESMTRHLYEAPATKFYWLEAKPVQGCKDQFTLKKFTYKRHHELGVSGKREVRQFPLSKSDTDSSVFTKDEVIQVIAQEEKRAEKEGYHITSKQPFAKKLAINVPRIA